MSSMWRVHGVLPPTFVLFGGRCNASDLTARTSNSLHDSWLYDGNLSEMRTHRGCTVINYRADRHYEIRLLKGIDHDEL